MVVNIISHFCKGAPKQPQNKQIALSCGKNMKTWGTHWRKGGLLNGVGREAGKGERKIRRDAVSQLEQLGGWSDAMY